MTSPGRRDVADSPAGAPAVAVAIVTSTVGVLVGRRRDGVPMWTFPCGEVEPGETPEDAAVRAALEETGLRVRVTGVIGSRIHPRTGVRIVYVVVVAVSEAEVRIREALTDSANSAGGELTEVRWVRLAGSRGADGRRDLRAGAPVPATRVMHLPNS